MVFAYVLSMLCLNKLLEKMLDETGSWQSVVGRWQSADGSWQLVVGSRQ